MATRSPLTSSVSVTDVYSEPRPSSRARASYARLSEKSLDENDIGFADTCEVHVLSM